ncbi:MAG: GNAT family N-acetyltransferase [Bacteroidales bacterium]|nr:GNAT family N-acetyltransferase [Bacteroidales bacterium]
MNIRKSTLEDLTRLMEIYREGREIMLSCGDVNQWKPGYPTEEIIRRDIELGQGCCIEDDGALVGAFAFIPGEDPTYRHIEGGEWLDDKSPYATIHRLASTKTSHGVARACFDWCWARARSLSVGPQAPVTLRIDTHEDNVIMRHCIAKAGFRYCGIIHLLSGDPRLAYQKISD